METKLEEAGAAVYDLGAAFQLIYRSRFFLGDKPLEFRTGAEANEFGLGEANPEGIDPDISKFLRCSYK